MCDVVARSSETWLGIRGDGFCEGRSLSLSVLARRLLSMHFYNIQDAAESRARGTKFCHLFSTAGYDIHEGTMCVSGVGGTVQLVNTTRYDIHEGTTCGSGVVSIRMCMLQIRTNIFAMCSKGGCIGNGIIMLYNEILLIFERSSRFPNNGIRILLTGWQ